MNEEKVMHMLGSSEAKRSRIRDEENIHQRRPCWSWVIPFTAALRRLHHGAYPSGPDSFDAMANKPAQLDILGEHKNRSKS
jgi:hypothetical protein